MVRHSLRNFHWFALAALAALAGCATTPHTETAATNDLQRAQSTLQSFSSNPQLAEQLKQAKAVIIAPSVTRAGFVVGGAGGEAVVLARSAESEGWSNPAFYKLHAGSVGLQIGADVSQVVMLVMTDKALNALLSPKFTLGADVSVAAGGMSQGAQASFADIVTYAKSRGAYAGITLAGAVIQPDAAANRTYYGRTASASDILVRQDVSNPSSMPLRRTLTQIARR